MNTNVSIFNNLPMEVENKFFTLGVTAWMKWTMGYRFETSEPKMFPVVVEPECESIPNNFDQIDPYEIIDVPTVEVGITVIKERIKAYKRK